MTEVRKLRERHPKVDIFLVRVGAKNAPVKIDWGSFHNERKTNNGRVGKSSWRNLGFVKKDMLERTHETNS
jgi:hypothetical protein